MKNCITAVAATALCIPVGAASAQDPDDVQVVEVERDPVEIYRDLDGPLDPAEYPNEFTIGGGALGFMSAGFDPEAPSSVSWNLRYGWHPINLLTWELAYTGATDEPTVAAQGDGTVATILETLGKIDVFAMSPVTPFVAAGVGYAAFTAGQQDLASLTVPVAAGLEARADNLLLATRFTYRPTYFDDLALSELGGDSWMWTADIGTRF